MENLGVPYFLAPKCTRLEDARVHRLELFSICHGSGLKLNANPNMAHRWLHCTHSQGANLNIGKINWYTVSFQSNVPNEISALFPWLFPIRSRTFHPKAVQERLVVQAPAQPGTTKVLRGRGPPRCDASGRGNLVLHFLLHLPRTLSPRQAVGSRCWNVETKGRKTDGAVETPCSIKRFQCSCCSCELLPAMSPNVSFCLETSLMEVFTPLASPADLLFLVIRWSWLKSLMDCRWPKREKGAALPGGRGFQQASHDSQGHRADMGGWFRIKPQHLADSMVVCTCMDSMKIGGSNMFQLYIHIYIFIIFYHPKCDGWDIQLPNTISSHCWVSISGGLVLIFRTLEPLLLLGCKAGVILLTFITICFPIHMEIFS